MILHQGGEKNPVVFAMSTSYGVVVLVLLLALTFLVVKRLTRRRRVERRPAWDGGVRRLLPEMTYTATGFSNPVRVVFDAIFRPSKAEETKEAVEGHFRTGIRNGREEVYILDRSIFQPLVATARLIANLVARMHSGSVNAYAAYVLVTLIFFLIIQGLF